jgi:hypothetical protein
MKFSGWPATPFELKLSQNHVLLLHRSGTRVSGRTDYSVAVVDANGQEIFVRAPGLDVPGATIVDVQDVTLTKRHVLIMSLFAWSAQQQVASLLIEYDLAAGGVVRMLRINLIGCIKVAADDRDENVVWCLGLDVAKANAGQRNYDILYRYSLAGDLLASSCPRTQLASRRLPWALSATAAPILLAERGKVTAWLPNTDGLVTWRGDATPAASVTTPPRSNTDKIQEDFALLHSGGLLGLFPIAAGVDRSDRRRAFFRWEPSQSTWSSVRRLPALPLHLSLVGLDGTAVVLWDRRDRKLLWYPFDETK